MTELNDIAEFVEYNQSELRSMKEQSPELHKAMTGVIDALMRKYGGVGKKTTKKTKTSPAINTSGTKAEAIEKTVIETLNSSISNPNQYESSYYIMRCSDIQQDDYTFVAVDLETGKVTYLNFTEADMTRLSLGEKTRNTEPTFLPVTIKKGNQQRYWGRWGIVFPSSYPRPIANKDDTRKGPSQSASAYYKVLSKQFSMPDFEIYAEGKDSIPFMVLGNNGNWWYLAKTKTSSAWRELKPMSPSTMKYSQDYTYYNNPLTDVTNYRQSIKQDKYAKMLTSQLNELLEQLEETLTYFDKSDPEYIETQEEISKIKLEKESRGK